MDYNLKKLGQLVFKHIALCLGKLAKTQTIVYLLFENLLYIVILLLCKHVVSDKGTSEVSIWGVFDPKTSKSP